MDFDNLRTLIQQGRYVIPSEAVADAILDRSFPQPSHRRHGLAPSPDPLDHSDGSSAGLHVVNADHRRPRGYR